MNYDETQQKLILREMERDLLAIVAINMENDDFEVIYSDGAYKDYKSRFHNKNFFYYWIQSGLPQVYEEDRFRMQEEISRKNLLERLKNNDTYCTICRFYRYGRPVYCRIKAAKDVLEKGIVIISIRDIDEEIRYDMERLAEMEELHRRETVYREAILANSAGFMEVNLTKDEITTKIYDYRDEWLPKELTIPELGAPISYDAFEKWWAGHMLLSDKEEFLAFSNCAHLIDCFHKDQRVVSIECRAKTITGEVSICLETYYISKDELTGDIVAVCVLYDLTQQHKRDQDMKELKKTLEQMRMKNFISQMHPHFLYNALSSIREIVLTDPEYGADMLYDFTTHLRASIRAMSNDDRIWFSQELENIKAYVNIEKMRFGDRLNVVYDIDCPDFMIIPLSIQPIIENAIKHGLYEKGADGGTVVLRIREADDHWEIFVTDDGIGFDPEEIRNQINAGERDSTGLYNLIFRLENMMNAEVGLQSEKGKGTSVSIRIPKKE